MMGSRSYNNYYLNGQPNSNSLMSGPRSQGSNGSSYTPPGYTAGHLPPSHGLSQRRPPLVMAQDDSTRLGTLSPPGMDQGNMTVAPRGVTLPYPGPQSHHPVSPPGPQSHPVSSPGPPSYPPLLSPGHQSYPTFPTPGPQNHPPLPSPGPQNHPFPSPQAGPQSHPSLPGPGPPQSRMGLLPLRNFVSSSLSAIQYAVGQRVHVHINVSGWVAGVIVGIVYLAEQITGKKYQVDYEFGGRPITGTFSHDELRPYGRPGG